MSDNMHFTILRNFNYSLTSIPHFSNKFIADLYAPSFMQTL